MPPLMKSLILLMTFEWEPCVIRCLICVIKHYKDDILLKAKSHLSSFGNLETVTGHLVLLIIHI